MLEKDDDWDTDEIRNKFFGKKFDFLFTVMQMFLANNMKTKLSNINFLRTIMVLKKKLDV